MRFLTMDFFLSLMITFFVAGILSQILIGVLYQHMIEEAENMQSTENKLMQQLKQKYISSYAQNDGVMNVSVFVDKFINRLQIGKISLNTLKTFSGQSMLLSVVSAGVGICKGLMDGKSLFSLIPYYMITFLGLYLYFSVLSIVDVPARKNMLKTNLVEYFENQMAAQKSVFAQTKLSEMIKEGQQLRAEENEGQLSMEEESFDRMRMPVMAQQEKEHSSLKDLDWTRMEPERKSSYLNEEQEQELARLLKDFLS